MITEINDIKDPRVAPYVSLTEQQLKNRLHPEQAIFIAESPKVIKVALEAHYQPISILCERKHIDGDAHQLISHITEHIDPTFPIYTGTRDLLAQLTGYTLTRGVLCAMRRPQPPQITQVLHQARRICVIDAVVDSTNIGAIFRSAAALGIDAILLTPTSCDPLNRRAIRVSMGSVFLIPWTWIAPQQDTTELLHQHGFKSVAMALRDRSIDLDDSILKTEPRLAIIMGNEGDGLSQQSIDHADYVVKIPMYHNVDSLNVAAASAIAFWELRAQDKTATQLATPSEVAIAYP